jgi:flavin reductase (DIM6/NTAB) family NADH-FMN oxidoreductase RutF
MTFFVKFFFNYDELYILGWATVLCVVVNSPVIAECLIARTGQVRPYNATQTMESVWVENPKQNLTK